MGRERQNTSLRRRQSYREPYDLVLIVCEGAKTEPRYFEGLKGKLKLSNANIRICGKECGTAPSSVVEYAVQEYKNNGKYDRIFCVFDKDQHETYSAALDKIRSTKLPGKTKIEAITSVPCFEYWLLLHFEDTAHPYATGRKSPCDNVITDLKKHISDYEKGAGDIFKRTYSLIDMAMQRAKSLKKRQAGMGTNNPSTNVHTLVMYMQNLKK